VGRVAYTDDVLLDEVARVARLVEGPVLTTVEFGKRARVCNSVTIRRRFGGWRATLERAGVGHMYAGPIEGRPWTIVHPFLSDEALLEEIRRVAGLVGKPVLKMADCDTHGRISSARLRRRFGDWRTTLERAGLGHMYSEWDHVRQSDEALLEEVRRVAQVVGKPVLSTACFDKYGRTSARTLYRRFGDWRTVLERAGVGHMYSGAVAGAPCQSTKL